MTATNTTPTCVDCVWAAAEVASTHTTYGRDSIPYRRAADEWGIHLTTHRAAGDGYEPMFPTDQYTYKPFPRPGAGSWPSR